MNNSANFAYAIIGIVTVIVLWTANNKRNKERIRQLESEYQMDLNGDSIYVKDHGRKVGTVHYTKLDSLICADSQ